MPTKDKQLFHELFTDPVVVQNKAQIQDFLVTPSRQKITTLLDDALALRELRQTTANEEILQYGGLGGVLIEGETGTGKDILIDSILKEKGCPYYSIPPSLSNDQKIEQLLKAFDEGAVVVIDKINSSPMMERLLNDLLMGKTPDGKRPSKPGFMVVGMQRPITMAGSQAISGALSRRMIQSKLPLYTTEEMVQIIAHKGLELSHAQGLVKDYNNRVKQAEQQNLNPKPSFHDLIRETEQIIKARKPENLTQMSKPLVSAEPTLFKEETIPLKEAIARAFKNYSEWYREGKNERAEMGFFTRMVHGEAGQQRAANWCEQVCLQDEGTGINSVNELLQDPKTPYRTHSFVSFLLDELTKIEPSPWSNIQRNKEYKQKKL